MNAISFFAAGVIMGILTGILVCDLGSAFDYNRANDLNTQADILNERKRRDLENNFNYEPYNPPPVYRRNPC